MSHEELGWEETTLPIIQVPVQLLDYLGLKGKSTDISWSKLLVRISVSLLELETWHFLQQEPMLPLSVSWALPGFVRWNTLPDGMSASFTLR